MSTHGDSGEMETVIEEVVSSNPESLTPWQAHYLDRLEHAANLKTSYEADPGSDTGPHRTPGNTNSGQAS